MIRSKKVTDPKYHGLNETSTRIQDLPISNIYPYHCRAVQFFIQRKTLGLIRTIHSHPVSKNKLKTTSNRAQTYIGTPRGISCSTEISSDSIYKYTIHRYTLRTNINRCTCVKQWEDFAALLMGRTLASFMILP